MSKREIPPIHPGEILLEDLMMPLGMTVEHLAAALNVNPRLVAQVVSGKARITANLGLRLSRHFDMSPRFWINLQARYDFLMAQERQAEEIERTVKVREDLRATA